MSKRSYSDEQLVVAVRKSVTIAQVLRAIGLVPAGGNYESVQARIRYLHLNTSHFLGQGWLKGKSITLRPAIPLEQVLLDGFRYNSYDLKRRLVQGGLKCLECENCGLTTWNGRSIPLELDHANGKKDDNRLKNLRLLCPNCHAQTHTYRGKNIGKQT